MASTVSRSTVTVRRTPREPWAASFTRSSPHAISSARTLSASERSRPWPKTISASSRSRGGWVRTTWRSVPRSSGDRGRSCMRQLFAARARDPARRPSRSRHQRAAVQDAARGAQLGDGGRAPCGRRPRRRSGGRVGLREHVGGGEADEELARDRVARPELRAALGAHVAHGDAGRPLAQRVEVLADRRGGLDHHERVQRRLVVDAEGRAAVAAEVAALHRSRAGREDDVRPVEHEPDRHDVRPAVGARRRKLSGPRAVRCERPPFLFVHDVHGQRPYRGAPGDRMRLPHRRYGDLTGGCDRRAMAAGTPRIGPGGLLGRIIVLAAVIVACLVARAAAHAPALLVVAVAGLVAATAGIAQVAAVLLRDAGEGDEAAPERAAPRAATLARGRRTGAATAGVALAAVALAIVLPHGDAAATATTPATAATADRTVRDFLGDAVLQNDSYDACQYLTQAAQARIARLAGEGESCRDALAATRPAFAGIASEQGLRELPLHTTLRDGAAIVRATPAAGRPATFVL